MTLRWNLQVVAVLGRSPREWRAFFEQDRARVRLWFSHFTHDGRHTRGARAICNFALAGVAPLDRKFRGKGFGLTVYGCAGARVVCKLASTGSRI